MKTKQLSLLLLGFAITGTAAYALGGMIKKTGPQLIAVVHGESDDDDDDGICEDCPPQLTVPNEGGAPDHPIPLFIAHDRTTETVDMYGLIEFHERSNTSGYGAVALELDRLVEPDDVLSATWEDIDESGRNDLLISTADKTFAWYDVTPGDAPYAVEFDDAWEVEGR